MRSQGQRPDMFQSAGSGRVPDTQDDAFGSGRIGVRGGLLGLTLGLVAVAGATFTLVQAAKTIGKAEQAATAPQPTIAPPVALEAIVTQANMFMRNGEQTAAEAILTQGIAQYPDDQDLRLAYADMLLNSERREDAYEQYVKALAIGPRDADLEYAAGTLASMVGSHDRAIEHLTAAQMSDPNSAEYALQLGQAHLQLEHRLEAKAALLRAVQIDPQMPLGWGMLAEIALRENFAEQALTHVRKARALQPTELAWKVIEARALKRTNDPQGALDVMAGIDNADRQSKPVLKLMSECYGMLRQPPLAMQLYADAIVRQPQDVELLFEGALWAERASERQQALNWAERAASGGHAAAINVASRLRASIRSGG